MLKVCQNNYSAAAKIEIHLSPGPAIPGREIMKSKFYLAAIVAYAIWGVFSLILKPMRIHNPVDILFYRVFACAGILLLVNLLFRRGVLVQQFVFFRQRKSREQIVTLGLTFLGGLLLVSNWLFFIYVVNNISIKAASFAYLVCPILTTLLAFFLLREQLNSWQWLAVGISLLSCLVLSFNGLRDTLYGLIIALTYAFYLISQRKNAGYDRFLVLSLQLIFGSVILLPFFPYYGSNLLNDGLFCLQITVVAVIFTILPLYLNLFSLQGLSSSTVGILLYINPLLNFVIAILIFRETFNTIQGIAYLLILTSIFIFNERVILRKRTQTGIAASAKLQKEE